MKQRLSILVFLLMSISMMAQWRIDNVPNTRLQSNDIHVSDPDNLVDDESEALINAACCSVRDSVDIFVVVLQSIGGDDSKDFATRLLNHWGIGDKDLDNGVLFLVVNDIHALEIETGYGAEGLLPDAICGRVIRDVVIPLMRADNFSGGVRSGAFALVSYLGGDTTGAMPSRLATYENVEYPDEIEDDTDTNMALAFLSFFAVLWCSVRTFFKSIGSVFKKKKKTAAVTKLTQVEGIYRVNYLDSYNAPQASSWSKEDVSRNLALIAVGFLSMIAYFAAQSHEMGAFWPSVLALTLFCLVQNGFSLRKANRRALTEPEPSLCFESLNRRPASILTMVCAPWLGFYFAKRYREAGKRYANVHHCPKCNAPMEKTDNSILTAVQRKEIEIHSIKHQHYRCPEGHETIVSLRGTSYMLYSQCPYCKGRTVKSTTKTIRKATEYTKGLEEVTYDCTLCDYHDVSQRSTPRLSSSISSSSSGGGYSSGGHSSGGSFGGGHSGGGGASGRW